MWFNFEFYKLKAYILLRQALNLFFKGVADGRMGFERHNEFAVRFKFRELETCTTCYSPQIFHLDTSGYFYAILPCKIAADGKPVILFISHLPVRRPQFSSLENPPSLGTTKGLAPFGILDYSYILIF